MNQTTASSRYRVLEPTRDVYLERAREASLLTIPSLVPPSGKTSSTEYKTPYQSLGARGTNNLSSKLLLTLFPPNSPFFRMTVDDFTLEQLTGQDGMRAIVEKALGKIERSVMTEIEQNAFRVSVFEGLKQLIVAGNVLLYVPPEGSMRVYHLDRFVCKRDPMGNVMETVTKEEIAPSTLAPHLQELAIGAATRPGNPGEEVKSVALYTWVKRTQSGWKVHQEFGEAGTKVPGSDGTYPKDKSPWLALRFTKIDGEDYGRGFIEEYIGDLKSFEALSKALVEGTAAAAKVLIFVNPNGTTRKKVVAEADNGAVVDGNRDDVTVLQLEKYADFRSAKELMAEIRTDLSFAFLLNSAIQRKGERVTAEEIRYMAGELEDALGGVYSILSQELQLPLVNALMHRMERQKKLPPLPQGSIKPSIVTGLEALGRGHDLNKLDVFLQGLLQTIGPDLLKQYLNVGDYITRRGTALGIDIAGLVKSEDEVAAAAQADQQTAMMSQLGPSAVQAGGRVVQEAMKQQPQAEAA